MTSNYSFQHRYLLFFCALPFMATFTSGLLLKLIIFDQIVYAQEDISIGENLHLGHILLLSVLTSLVSLVVWYLFMKRAKSTLDGVMAGILTVFLCYLFLGVGIQMLSLTNFPIVGVSSFFSVVWLFALLGNIYTFWITYPLGALFGGLIASRMLANRELKAEIFD